MPGPGKRRSLQPLVEQWTLPSAATLGSTVRAKGILLEVRARLAPKLKKLIDFESGAITLRIAEGSDVDALAISAVVSDTLRGIEHQSVIPREIEDILAISSTERHRWLKDGRLRSVGTKNVKLRGRARKITFHVFDPRFVEDLLDRDLVTVWREEDAMAANENRRRAAGRAALTRAKKQGKQSAGASEGHDKLDGWDAFEKEGFLR
ncbi:MAG: hypothetical protein AB7V46_10165 [Thermomicrobiales bacterium]